MHDSYFYIGPKCIISIHFVKISHSKRNLCLSSSKLRSFELLPTVGLHTVLIIYFYGKPFKPWMKIRLENTFSVLSITKQMGPIRASQENRAPKNRDLLTFRKMHLTNFRGPPFLGSLFSRLTWGHSGILENGRTLKSKTGTDWSICQKINGVLLQYFFKHLID